MAIKEKGYERFRPYARLISILGDQLISNKWVGVIELVKNCYDADAEHVYVRFLNFSGNSPNTYPVIEIEDDGEGLSIDIIKNIWMKPATPNKLNKKKSEERFTKKGRLMQGDKGVGRFAVYKLGNYIEICSKTAESDEVKLKLNFRSYTQNDEFSDTNNEVNKKFLDEIDNEWEVHDVPERINNSKKQGTVIRISDLRNDWKEEDLDKLAKAFYKMTPPVITGLKQNSLSDFRVKSFWDGKEYKANLLPFEKIIEMAPFSFEGSIEDTGKFTFIYRHNKNEKIAEINLFEDTKHNISKLKLFKEQFYKYNKETKKSEFSRFPSVGEFYFYFYAFDWLNKIEGLKKEEEEYIKENSVYLYRDFTRVYPYGERGVDWLMLSRFRAEDRAGNYFSYNDLIGFVFINQKRNPKLRDAADREGLINIDGAYDDFVALVQAGLKVMKDYVEVDKVKQKIKKEKGLISVNEQFDKAYKSLEEELAKHDDKVVLDKTQKLFKSTNNLISRYKENLQITQELAGLGMAVEKSSHDTMSLLRLLRKNSDDYINRFEKGTVSKQELVLFLKDLQDNLDFLFQELQVLQPLFRVTRKISKPVSIEDVTARVQRYFRKELEGNIEVTVDCIKDIVVETNIGLLLQVLINLMDNAIYWVKIQDPKDKKIVIQIDSTNNRIIFADNGTGVDADAADVIFMEFFSQKADGRGLGLYIVKELLERINAEITVITDEKLKVLPGANFLINFNIET